MCDDPALGQSDASTTQPSGESYVAPDREEANLAFVACVEEAGFVTEELPDGGIHVDSPAGQTEQFQQTMRECMRASSGLDGSAPPPTKEQLERYLHGLRELASCLEDRGYSISEAPTTDAYVDQSVGTWDPLGEVIAEENLSPRELNDLTEMCPQPQIYSAP